MGKQKEDEKVILIELTPREKEILTTFRQLPKEEQEDILNWIRWKLEHNKKESKTEKE